MQKSDAPKRWMLPLSLALSGALIVYVLWGLDWSQLLAELWRVNFWYLLGIIPLLYAAIVIRAVRWRYMLPNSSRYLYRNLFDATALSIMGLFVLPLRAGEFVRPIVLSRSEEVSFSAALASVVNERIYDVLAVLALLGFTLTQLDGEIKLVTVGARVLGTLAASLLCVVVAAYLRGEQLVRFGTWVCQTFVAPLSHTLSDKLIEMGVDFVEGLKAVESFRDFCLILLLTGCLWLSYLCVYQIGLMSMGEFPSFVVSCVLCVLVGLAIAAPAAPGFIGTFQFGCLLALTTVYEYSHEFAVAYSLLIHSIQAVFAVAFGTFVLNARGLSMWQLKSRDI